jgi:hypothetical protein
MASSSSAGDVNLYPDVPERLRVWGPLEDVEIKDIPRSWQAGPSGPHDIEIKESEESEQKQFERANFFQYGPLQPWKSFVPAKKVEKGELMYLELGDSTLLKKLNPSLPYKEAKWYESLKWLFIIIATYLDGYDAYRVLLDIQVSIKNWIRRDRRADDVAFGETFFIAYQKGFQRGKAAAAIMLAAQIPRGESKDLLSLTLPRRRTAAAAWLSEPVILAENILVALFIILVTTLACYGLYRIALDLYNPAVGWFRRDRKAAELVMAKVPTETEIDLCYAGMMADVGLEDWQAAHGEQEGARLFGVQEFLATVHERHYSWYDADPRFRAHQNGFRRSGEVTVADE